MSFRERLAGNVAHFFTDSRIMTALGGAAGLFTAAAVHQGSLTRGAIITTVGAGAGYVASWLGKAGLTLAFCKTLEDATPPEGIPLPNPEGYAKIGVPSAVIPAVAALALLHPSSPISVTEPLAQENPAVHSLTIQAPQ